MTRHEGLLNVWVFGPGYGEFVVVHVPPTGWLAVDGCSAGGGDGWPRRFFEAQDVTPTHILMTHPHHDHATGLVELIDDATPATDTGSWPLLGVLEPAAHPPAVPDLEAGFHGQEANLVLSAMRDRWARSSKCRWDLTVGAPKPLGAGAVTVLSPAGPTGGDPNERSTALEVEWGEMRVVLGADLVEDPGSGWSQVLAVRPRARRHLALKVPHHGSPKALHEPLLERSAREPESVPVLTPYSKGLKLPHFGADSGVEVLLRHSRAVLMTALPQRYATQAREPRTFTRAELEAASRPIAPVEPVDGFPSCFVQLAFDSSGVEKHRTTTGVTVTR